MLTSPDGRSGGASRGPSPDPALSTRTGSCSPKTCRHPLSSTRTTTTRATTAIVARKIRTGSAFAEPVCSTYQDTRRCAGSGRATNEPPVSGYSDVSWSFFLPWHQPEPDVRGPPATLQRLPASGLLDGHF